MYQAFGSFQLTDAFPDIKNQFHHFRADPFLPGRVWFTTLGSGTNTGTFGTQEKTKGPLTLGSLNPKP